MLKQRLKLLKILVLTLILRTNTVYNQANQKSIVGSFHYSKFF